MALYKDTPKHLKIFLPSAVLLSASHWHLSDLGTVSNKHIRVANEKPACQAFSKEHKPNLMCWSLGREKIVPSFIFANFSVVKI